MKCSKASLTVNSNLPKIAKKPTTNYPSASEHLNIRHDQQSINTEFTNNIKTQRHPSCAIQVQDKNVQ